AEARQGPRGLGCPTAVGLYAPLKPLAGCGRAGLGPESSSGTGGVSDEALAEAPRRAMTSTTHRHEIGGSGFETTPELLSESGEAREGGVPFGSFSRQNLGRSKPDEGDTAVTRLLALLPGSLAGKKDGPLLSSSAAQGVNCRNGPARSGK